MISEVKGGFILLFCLLQACQPKPNESRYHGSAQGTTFSIICSGSDNPDLTEAIDSLFQVIDLSASGYLENSLISRINRNETNVLDEHLLYLVKSSEEISKKTDGAFDITVGPLVKAWGFGPSGIVEKAPNPDTILPYIGFEKLSLQGDTLIKSHPSISLDFNAIAQGYSVDLMADMVELYGINNYMIEIGGEVRCSGKDPSGKNWVIAIEKPEAGNQRTIQELIALENKSLATSGNYRKSHEINGRLVSHSIDPKTGFPVQRSILSASVISDLCSDADALATAFMVMGVEKSDSLLQAGKFPGVEALFLYTDSLGKLSQKSTANFPFLPKN